MTFKKLSDTELKVMNKIWENMDGVESDVIYEYFQNEYAVSTIGTILKRILQKGCATKQRKGLHYIFIPLISSTEYFQTIEEYELTKVTNKIETLIASFCGKQKLSSEQAEALRNILKDMKND